MTLLLKVAKGERLSALMKALTALVPSHMIPFSLKEKVIDAAKPAAHWGIVFKNANNVLYEMDLKTLEGEIGPFTTHLVSDADGVTGQVGRFGIISDGMFDNEQNHLLVLSEVDGGGVGAIHYAVHPKFGLLIGLIPANRNRKMRLKGYEAPRGYKKDTLKGIRERMNSSAATAMEESAEEATVFEGMTPTPITWADGTSFMSDQNSGVMSSGANQGFKYESVRWPMYLLVQGDKPNVWMPDTKNPVVTQSAGEADAGHTGEMYFVPYESIFDRSSLPGWNFTVSADGLGTLGAAALRSMLKRKGVRVE